MRDLFRGFSREWTYESEVYPPSPSYMFEATLASALPGANFQAEVTVEWRGSEPEAEAKVRAFTWDHLARWAATRRVTDASHLADLINARGVSEIPVPRTALVLTHLHVRITVPAEALAATTTWEEAERRATLEEQRREGELRQLRWLRDEIFGKPDLARMYWHLRHPADLRALADPVFDTVAIQLGSGQPVTAPPQVKEDSVSVLIGKFLAGLGADERWHLIGQLDRVFRSFDRPDLANQLGEPSDRTAS
ncbi:hypothetical protein [Micromonospora sagamiensis]|uniref:Uncharacterized protein n=1 Tax=Micromonospora sagamiensis TaxID=47875 RepID=A0A562WC59_9ACTN|nr:hypothetical protein [Micromonospora sagamiensis]TWJ27842.1 hypothetical protein JD81_01342 [Micromonospora sagamiensis]BCL13269.1 hypothetical protein GCM10017556_10080 [Micromonospora sagamiensis]